ncbi:unnamed protein product [Adineta ricciae]|uniref:Protein Wnt n=1 Tax=Adineta ricciae TaxID=249248 RepID=A0A814LSQ2_ADIRI|nr:unnamed protein product [Adineta ricciae]
MKKSPVLLLLFGIFIHPSQQWLSIIQVSNVSVAEEDLCQIKYGLHHRQIQFCQRNLHLMPYVSIGTSLALEECQLQFQNRHWNCKLFENNQLIGNILDSETKESAYIHALTSAGIAYAITKACSSGQLRSCGCDMTTIDQDRNNSMRWMGCSDNTFYGTEMARKFVNLRENRKKTATSLLNRYNNQVGIRTILSANERRCKCHGVSGSCEFKSCWQSLQPFTQIAKQLKEFYDNSIEVQFQRSSLDSKIRFTPKNVPFHREQQVFYGKKLIFIISSPNYCESNLSLGSFGTKGRVCNRNSRAIDSCDLLCCNRGYQSKIITIQRQCNCRFQWCCHVQCQNCVTTQEISYCL